MYQETLQIPLDSLNSPIIERHKINLKLLRIDQTHPMISGNKWFKLKYNLIQAQQKQHHTLVSFGGAYSNHLHALAYAGKKYHFNTIGIIRGEEYYPLNPTLSDASQMGMKLYYIDRKTYQQKHTQEVKDYISQIIVQDDPFKLGANSQRFYLIPEGGTNQNAVLGASEIAQFIPDNTDYVCLACGTGGTIAGVISGLSNTNKQHTTVIGFPALKKSEFLYQNIHDLVIEQQLKKTMLPWKLLCDWHFGGFAKSTPELRQFTQDFEHHHHIDLDPIYTAKMMYAIDSLIQDNYFPAHSNIVAIHTGGLQGKRGMMNKKKLLT